MRYGDYIRIYIGKTVTESELPKSTKQEMLKYVKEANIYELMNLMAEGKKFTITEDDKRSVLESFESCPLGAEIKENYENGVNLQEGVAKSILGILVSPPLWVAWRTAKGIMSKAQRSCGAYKISNKRDVCIAQYKIKSYQEQIKVLEKVKKEAKSDKQKEKVSQKIDSLKKKINKKQNKIKKLKKDEPKD